MGNNWKKVFSLVSAVVLAFGFSGCQLPGSGASSGDGENVDEAPVVTVGATSVLAMAGDAINVPKATVKDEDATLTASVALYQGESKVADVEDGAIPNLDAGEYTLRYEAKDAKAQTGTVNVALKVVENLVNVDLTETVAAGGATEIHLGAAAIKAAGEADGVFDMSNYDYIRSDITNLTSSSVLFGTKINSSTATVDVGSIKDSQYSALTIKENATRTLRFSEDYLTHNSGDELKGITSVVYYVSNNDEADKEISFRINDFVLGKLDTLETISFREKESDTDMVSLTNFKALVDFNGATVADYIGQTKVKGGGEILTKVEDGKLVTGVTEGEENQSTLQWQFYSYKSDQGIAKQSLLKRDLSDVNYLVMVFEKEPEYNYMGATICLYLQSDGWGVSYDLPCSYQGLANMWYSGIKNQDGENENLVYYAIPIAQSIEDEKIQLDWCKNVDTLIVQMAACPVEETTQVKIRGIYWC